MSVVSTGQLTDERREDENEETANQEVLASLESQEEAVEQPQEETQDDLPEKYRGKSLQDVVRMHQEAEKALGRQSSEVGELRKVVDEYVASNQLTQNAVQEQQEDEIDYWTNPSGATNQQIANHPTVKKLEQQYTKFQKEAALQALKSRHPDMDRILSDDNFVSWVKSSNYRTKMFVDADQKYDYDAADELFTLWKERTQSAETAVAVQKEARKTKAKAASTGGAKGAATGGRKKIYRQADIIKLMRDDPDRYVALQPELYVAYAEGRVR